MTVPCSPHPLRLDREGAAAGVRHRRRQPKEMPLIKTVRERRHPGGAEHCLWISLHRTGGKFHKKMIIRRRTLLRRESPAKTGRSPHDLYTMHQ
jgi:hypothetical protein